MLFCLHVFTLRIWVVRCFLNTIFVHCLGPGVSTRAGRGRSPPICRVRGAPGLVFPVTLAIAWVDVSRNVVDVVDSEDAIDVIDHI